MNSEYRDQTLSDVIKEMDAQDEYCGVQNHPDTVWNMILTEEVGEVAQAASEHVFRGGPSEKMRKELIQVAAVAIQWAWRIDFRQKHGERM